MFAPNTTDGRHGHVACQVAHPCVAFMALTASSNMSASLSGASLVVPAAYQASGGASTVVITGDRSYAGSYHDDDDDNDESLVFGS